MTPLWQMDVRELLDELVLQSINYTTLKHQFIEEIKKEILKRFEDEEKRIRDR
jgi:diphthamide synthase (EF-2-diphthine--ammonia ligase)